MQTHTASDAIVQARHRAFWRVPMSVIAALAVLVSLLHYHCAVAGELNSTQITAAATALYTPPADNSDHQSPAQSGHCVHCLCHAGFQFVALDSIPIQFSDTAYLLMASRAPGSVAGLPLFKPPRA